MAFRWEDSDSNQRWSNPWSISFNHSLSMCGFLIKICYMTRSSFEESMKSSTSQPFLNLIFMYLNLHYVVTPLHALLKGYRIFYSSVDGFSFQKISEWNMFLKFTKQVHSFLLVIKRILLLINKSPLTNIACVLSCINVSYLRFVSLIRQSAS